VDAVEANVVAGRHRADGALKVVDRQCQLFEVVAARRFGGGVADLLHGGQKHADEDADDGDDHQQLDQREGAPSNISFHDTSPKRKRNNTG
jgi:hypothetical protein